MKSFSIKTKLIIFLAGFAVFLSIRDKDAAFLFTIITALISAIIADLAFSYAFAAKNLAFQGKDGQWTPKYPTFGASAFVRGLHFKVRNLSISESSVISALIIGFVLASDNPWWIIVLASLFAISSKHLIRFNKKHVFNPAAFGIFLSILLFGANTQWKGTFFWYIILPIGLYFTYKIRKLELIIGYLITALGLFGIQAVLNKVLLINIFGYLSYFYVFIMLIEPKTTPIKPLAKLAFGIGAAALIFTFIQAQVRFDPELATLLILNLFVPLLNKIPERRKE
ncbi:MAG: RnfABCDGE type electron transport complex subunit D [Candidatus Omnitrophica bacterium]|nr:RnfABCDGE type electron transport complex subunit D [Candidatus Omnitrophota bacterium]MBU1923989.1 RnfABCDGE type electron transport complex subunit D [Candidatus Omnitrophota bacterium]